MPTRPSLLSLQPSDTRLLGHLKLGESLARSDRYEWVTVDKLSPIEQLLDSLARGPALDLSWQDEFQSPRNPIPSAPPVYVINEQGRFWQIYQAWQSLDDVCRSIPVNHLSPHVQAFDRVLRQDDLMTVFDSTQESSYHTAVLQSVDAARSQRVLRPLSRFTPLLWAPELGRGYTQQEAQQMLKNSNQYLRFLVAVLKQSAIKRAQRRWLQQAEQHYTRLQQLFRKTLAFTSPVLLVYLDLEGPVRAADNAQAGEQDADHHQAYASLNAARTAFLKPRQHHPLFHGLISYAWKYRYSYGRGLTCMMVLFYDGNQARQRHSLTHALGQHWQDVAGEGSRYSSPVTDASAATKAQHFGLLEAKDAAVRKGLDALARFMGLYQLYVKPVAPKYMNTLDMSKAPETSAKRKPRRRQPKHNG